MRAPIAFSLVAAPAALAALALAPSLAVAQETALVTPVHGPSLTPESTESARALLRQELERRGYAVREAAPPPGSDDAMLGALAASEGASLVFDVSVEDFAGMSSLRVRLLGSDGRLRAEASDLVAEGTLHGELPRLLGMVLAEAGGPAAAASGGLEAPWGPEPYGASRPAVAPGGEGSGAPPRIRARRRVRRMPDRAFWLGGLVEPAMGTNREAFNLMLGGRAEYQWRGLTVGLNLAYTYVVDWEPRSDPDYHTLAIFPVIGYRIALGTGRFALPLLAGGGYVPGNGGLLRFEAGVSYRATDRVDLRFIFISPSFWFLDDTTVLFVSFSFQVMAGL